MMFNIMKWYLIPWNISTISHLIVLLSAMFMRVFPSSVLKDPGGLTDYIAAEYIPDFLGGPYEVTI